MAFKAEIWRGLGILEHHGVAVNKEKTRRKTRALCKHIQFWWAARKDPLTNSGGPQTEKSHWQSHWSTSKEGQLPKCPASSLVWEDRPCWQKLSQSHPNRPAGTTADPVRVTTAFSSSPFSPGLPLKAREVPQDWKRKGVWEAHVVHLLPSPSECRPHQWKA